ncbi:hypothetical protein D3C73_1560860 [compost metagenome]
MRAKMEGGGGSSKILRTVAMLVVVVASIYTGGAVGGGLYGALAQGAVMIGGTLIISPLIPEIRP